MVWNEQRDLRICELLIKHSICASYHGLSRFIQPGYPHEIIWSGHLPPHTIASLTYNVIFSPHVTRLPLWEPRLSNCECWVGRWVAVERISLHSTYQRLEWETFAANISIKWLKSLGKSNQRESNNANYELSNLCRLRTRRFVLLFCLLQIFKFCLEIIQWKYYLPSNFFHFLLKVFKSQLTRPKAPTLHRESSRPKAPTWHMLINIDTTDPAMVWNDQPSHRLDKPCSIYIPCSRVSFKSLWTFNVLF